MGYPCKAEKSGSNGNFTKINIVVKKNNNEACEYKTVKHTNNFPRELVFG